MRTLTVLFTSLAIVMGGALLQSCGESSFAGNNGKKSADARPAKPTKPSKPGSGDPGTDLGQDVDGDATTPGAGDDDDETNGDEDLGNEADVFTPEVPLVDDDITSQPNDNEIIFGPDKLFHIGDGALSGSSCLSKVSSYDVAGTRYYFEFEVKKDDTRVEISVLDVCGIDAPDTNFVYLKRGGATIATELIQAFATSFSFPSQTLSKGKYILEIESQVGSIAPGASPTDHDDFLLGNIRVKASAPIRAGVVGTN